MNFEAERLGSGDGEEMTMKMRFEHEEWRPVVGYEGYYEVSNMGRVRSIAREVYTISKHGTESKSMINIIPKNDEMIHQQSPDCWCGPLIENESDDGTPYENGPIITHNAADHREFVERVTGELLDEDKQWGAH